MIDDAYGEADGGARGDPGVIARVARGDTSALAELYDRHSRAVFGLALRIVTDTADAEEVVQDVFTQVWRQIERYDQSRASVAGWLLMMTRTRALDRVRARHARPDSLAGDAPLRDLSTGIPNQEARAIDVQDVHALEGALRALPETLRAPVELAYYEGLSHSEIATRLGAPLGTVKTRMRTALLRLRVALRLGGVE